MQTIKELSSFFNTGRQSIFRFKPNGFDSRKASALFCFAHINERGGAYCLVINPSVLLRKPPPLNKGRLVWEGCSLHFVCAYLLSSSTKQAWSPFSAGEGKGESQFVTAGEGKGRSRYVKESFVGACCLKILRFAQNDRFGSVEGKGEVERGESIRYRRGRQSLAYHALQLKPNYLEMIFGAEEASLLA